MKSICLTWISRLLYRHSHEQSLGKGINERSRSLDVGSQIADDDLVRDNLSCVDRGAFGAQGDPDKTVDITERRRFLEIDERGVVNVGHSELGAFAQGFALAHLNSSPLQVGFSCLNRGAEAYQSMQESRAS